MTTTSHDQSLLLRRAIVTRLRADDGLTALLPAARVYGMRAPATVDWPFVRYGTPDELPLRTGSQIRITIDAFSKAQFEDEVAGILAALNSSLTDAVLTLPSGLKAYMVWKGSTIVGDAAEADAWHGIARWDAVIG